MSDQEQVTQLSALFDGELPQQQAELVIRRALKDADLRASWSRYALIGACMRGEPLALRHDVADRVQASLVAERELNLTVLPNRGGFKRAVSGEGGSWLGRGALGGAIAAGVAVMSIFVVRNMGSADAPALLAQGVADPVVQVVEAGAAGSALVAQSDGAPGSYTTPGANSPAQRRVVDSALGSYLVAHSEEAASALRSSYDLPQGQVELTEDQISALR